MVETIFLGIACLAAPLIAKHAGYEIRKKPFDLVGVGGLFFLLAAAFSLGPAKVDFLANIGGIGSIASHVLGWLMLIIGAFRSAVDVVTEKEVRVKADDVKSLKKTGQFSGNGSIDSGGNGGSKPPANHEIKSRYKDSESVENKETKRNRQSN